MRPFLHEFAPHVGYRYSWRERLIRRRYLHHRLGRRHGLLGPLFGMLWLVLGLAIAFDHESRRTFVHWMQDLGYLFAGY